LLNPLTCSYPSVEGAWLKNPMDLLQLVLLWLHASTVVIQRRFSSTLTLPGTCLLHINSLVAVVTCSFHSLGQNNWSAKKLG
jgi:hypothetical protein